MVFSDRDQYIFNRITSDNLENAKMRLREQQSFSLQGLKDLHDQTFFPYPALPDSIKQEMQNYFNMRPENEEWQKPRYDVAYPPYITFYSPRATNDFQNAENAIAATSPEEMKNLSFDEKIHRLAEAYGEIDYLHAFSDGNSRVNRAFIGELAKASGVELDFTKVDHITMYAARDKSLAEKNITRRPEQLKKITYMSTTADVGIGYSLEDLNALHPGVTLQSVFKGIATEIQQSLTTEKKKNYEHERVVVNSQGASLQRKDGVGWVEIDRTPVSRMQAGIHMLGLAKKAEPSQVHEGEIVHKDAASVFQKTKAGLVRHESESISKQVKIGQKCVIQHEDNKQARIVQASGKSQAVVQRRKI